MGVDSRFLTATEKARLPIWSLVLGTKSCLEMDDLRVLEISEKCSRFIKYVGYSVADLN